MPKNVVMIMCDQLRKDYIGSYGNPYVRTPNIDAIAQNGVKFEQCFVTNPICMPNRMSIYTGRYPHNHGMYTNGLMFDHPLPTMADTFNAEGYDTCVIGKLHTEPTDSGDSTPMRSMEDHRLWKQKGDDVDWFGPYWGFNHVEFTSGHATRPLAHYGKWFHERGGTDEMAIAKRIDGFTECPVTTMPEKLHDSIFVGERSADYIKAHAQDDKPFFLLASFPDPHHPFNPPHETAIRYKDVPIKRPVSEDDPLTTRPSHYALHKKKIWHRGGILADLPSMTDEQKAKRRKNMETIAEFMDSKIQDGLGLISGKEGQEDTSVEERNQRIRNTYAMVDLIDQGVGKIMEALEATEILEDTVILFTSDHGELMGDHGLWYKGPFFYDGLINVPLIIQAKGVTPSTTCALASSADIFPTLCDLAGIPKPCYIEGVSQVPALAGGSCRDRVLIQYRNGYFDNDVSTFGYVDENYKYIQYQNGENELTDRKNDPKEDVNLAADSAHATLVTRCREILLQTIINTSSKYPVQICHA